MASAHKNFFMPRDAERGATIRSLFRLLVVVQDGQTASVFNQAAMKIGADLASADNPERAARYVRDGPYEVIFVDTSLARLSRQGFTRLVRTSRFNHETPLVFLTRYPGGTAEFSSLGIGVTGMPRPSRLAQLLPFLEELKRKLSADRRADRRLAFLTPVSLAQGARRMRATSLNLSATGMLLEITWPPVVGERFEVLFQLETGALSFRGWLRIVRAEGEGRAAVAFEKLSVEDRDRLRHFIDAHLPGR